MYFETYEENHYITFLIIYFSMSYEKGSAKILRRIKRCSENAILKLIDIAPNKP